MFIASIGINGWKFEALLVNPMICLSASTLIKMGAKESHLIVNEGEGWWLITPMVLHAGIIHYAVNMLSLLIIGSAVEKSHGSFATATIFIIPAIGGTILSGISFRITYLLVLDFWSHRCMCCGHCTELVSSI